MSEQQFTTDELSRLRDLIGKPSMQPPPPCSDPLVESVYRQAVQLFPSGSGSGRRSRCNHCGVEANVEGFVIRHQSTCELAQLFIKAGAAAQVMLIFGSRLNAVAKPATEV